jgi:hypothetical protein
MANSIPEDAPQRTERAKTTTVSKQEMLELASFLYGRYEAKKTANGIKTVTKRQLSST